ncbi:alpha/beta hydrolase family protein [Maribacter halichondriae]|uniref:alpha/beta hydrolase family protein n=1 Tax=Maribacter halichondriae TaxID=2980554 RepID=UPI0023593A57|nr:acetylxylan esterase [Maribacter sp. Hal144]
MKSLFYIFFIIISPMAFSQVEPNYDESKVPEFLVPDPLMAFDGTKIKDAKAWTEKRRPEVLAFFENEVFGKVPGELDAFSFEIIEEDANALDGIAHRKQIAVTLTKNKKTLQFNILLYTPSGKDNVPVFLGYNFHGNQTVTSDPKVKITKAWNMKNDNLGIVNHQATEKTRGGRAHRWDINGIIKAGFGLATIYYGEVDPDKNDLSDGLHRLFYKEGHQNPEANEWGSIAAWSFALSKAFDYLETDPNVDATKVVAFGHSRLGKAALWAGATDTRFAGVISNDSGCGGAALSKRKFGETVGRINNSFPHWFNTNFKKYNENEEALPVDQHQLLALVAPRPLYVASAEEDEWADPKGEFLSAHYATPVYHLFGKQGIESTEMPKVNTPIQNTVAYHIRTGVHDVTDYDWEQYIKWAKEFVE